MVGKKESHSFAMVHKVPTVSYYKYGTIVVLRHPVTTLVTAFTIPDNLGNNI